MRFVGKAELQARRNEKLAQRNPERIQQQIDQLKAIKESTGKLSTFEEQSLEALEKDLKAVKKAREALGDKAPVFRSGGRRGSGGDGGGVLGKRRRDQEDGSSDDSDVPEDVKRIPMPRDTPPPIPKEILDQWYAKRRAKRGNANQEPLGDQQKLQGRQDRQSSERSKTPVAEPKVVYEAKPIVRDLKKEAVSAFMPAVVRAKLEKGKGQAGLLSPEEADRLEKEGYLNFSQQAVATTQTTETDVNRTTGPRKVMLEEVEDDD